MRCRLLSSSLVLLTLLHLAPDCVLANSFQSGLRNSATCVRQPEGVTASKTPGDNGYRIKISGNPEKYFPGEVYTGD